MIHKINIYSFPSFPFPFPFPFLHPGIPIPESKDRHTQRCPGVAGRTGCCTSARGICPGAAAGVAWAPRTAACERSVAGGVGCCIKSCCCWSRACSVPFLGQEHHFFFQPRNRRCPSEHHAHNYGICCSRTARWRWRKRRRKCCCRPSVVAVSTAQSAGIVDKTPSSDGPSGRSVEVAP